MWHDLKIPSVSCHSVSELTGYSPYFNLGGGCGDCGHDSSNSDSCFSPSMMLLQDTDSPLEWSESSLSMTETDPALLADTDQHDWLFVCDTREAVCEWAVSDHGFDRTAGNAEDA